MIDVTVIVHSICVDIFIPTWSRILTSNLNNDERINVTYGFEPETEIVLVSCHYISDASEVHRMLKLNKKVVMGGACCFINSNETIHNELNRMGGVNLDNLIIVRGYVSKYTDLYTIIKEWKDVDIDEDISSIWECEEDCLLDYKEKYNIKESCAIYIMNNKCVHGKCKYCAFRQLNRMKHKIDPDIIANHINTMANKYGSNKIFLADNVFIFTEKNIEILKKINHNEIMIFTTIKQMSDRSYVENVNKYINRVTVGMESFVDFSLSYVNKGYTTKDILNAVKNMVQYMNKDIILYMNIITDLPVRNVRDIEFQHRMLQKVNELLLSSGIKIEWHIHKLYLRPDSEMIDDKYLKVIRRVDDEICFRRFDAKGDMLPTDADIFDIDSIKNSLRMN